jgi:predicted nucleotidyltransferase
VFQVWLIIVVGLEIALKTYLGNGDEDMVAKIKKILSFSHVKIERHFCRNYVKAYGNKFENSTFESFT